MDPRRAQPIRLVSGASSLTTFVLDFTDARRRRRTGVDPSEASGMAGEREAGSAEEGKRGGGCPRRAYSIYHFLVPLGPPNPWLVFLRERGFVRLFLLALDVITTYFLPHCTAAAFGARASPINSSLLSFLFRGLTVIHSRRRPLLHRPRPSSLRLAIVAKGGVTCGTTITAPSFLPQWDRALSRYRGSDAHANGLRPRYIPSCARPSLGGGNRTGAAISRVSGCASLQR
ncbi:hypothetical protein B0H19DRAFT_1379106 [Mycena capillaripes]|nr:hypothetical protein B0H19DRAFT_1379106 [Mycena capillaripes]